MDYKYGEKFMAPILLTEFTGSLLVMLAFNMAGDDTLVVPLTYFAMIVSCYDLSGGLLNPGVTLGVYISTKRYVHNLLFMIIIIVAQTLGCLFALGLGYLLRVQMTDQATG
jgi:glycerol uptake facilitator-like aquaporin